MKIFKRLILLSTLLLVFVISVKTAGSDDAPKLDKYGGFLNIKGTATGYFHVEKLDDRFWFITPEGHAFWSIGVNLVSDAPGDGKDEDGNRYMDNLLKKFRSKPIWANETAKKLVNWGVNTIGAGSSTYIDPLGMYVRRPTEPRIVKTFKRRFGLYAVRDFGVANILKGVKGGGLFPDVFDPRFLEWADREAKRSATTGGMEADAKSPWTLGYYTDEELRGFGHNNKHVHLGWAAGATNLTTYTKRAWRDFLREKYKTLEALNSAYGTGYTTWQTNSRSGVLDEKGLGDHVKGSRNTAIKKDQDEFLYIISRTYFEITTKAMRKYRPNHLILGPMFSTWSNTPRDEVLLAAKDFIDVFGVHESADHKRIYELTGKPTVVYTWWFTAEADSPLHFVRPRCKNRTCVKNQQERGKGYKKRLLELANLKADDGTYIVLGSHWWKYSDNGPDFWREKRNFGIVTIRDNAYDGVEARRQRGKDVEGYDVGGEVNDYGDFVSHFVEGNRLVREKFLAPVPLSSNKRVN